MYGTRKRAGEAGEAGEAGGDGGAEEKKLFLLQGVRLLNRFMAENKIFVIETLGASMQGVDSQASNLEHGFTSPLPCLFLTDATLGKDKLN